MEGESRNKTKVTADFSIANPQNMNARIKLAVFNAVLCWRAVSGWAQPKRR
jgi:hypothetical protein